MSKPAITIIRAIIPKIKSKELFSIIFFQSWGVMSNGGLGYWGLMNIFYCLLLIIKEAKDNHGNWALAALKKPVSLQNLPPSYNRVK